MLIYLIDHILRSDNILAVVTCKCSGDPHCESFDGKWWHFHGACYYTLIQDGCDGGLPNDVQSFKIDVKQWRRDPWKSVAYLKELRITIGETVNLNVAPYHSLTSWP